MLFAALYNDYADEDVGIAPRGLETVAGGGMSTLGHWAGHARRKAKE